MQNRFVWYSVVYCCKLSYVRSVFVLYYWFRR